MSAVGFDYRGIEGSDLAVRQLRPDSMASELAFIAYLAQSAADLRSVDEAASVRAEELLTQFVGEHAGAWFDRAADVVRRADNDLYARVCALAAETTAAWVV